MTKRQIECQKEKGLGRWRCRLGAASKKKLVLLGGPDHKMADIRGTLLPVLTNGGRDAPATIPDVMKNLRVPTSTPNAHIK